MPTYFDRLGLTLWEVPAAPQLSLLDKAPPVAPVLLSRQGTVLPSGQPIPAVLYLWTPARYAEAFFSFQKEVQLHEDLRCPKAADRLRTIFRVLRAKATSLHGQEALQIALRDYERGTSSSLLPSESSPEARKVLPQEGLKFEFLGPSFPEEVSPPPSLTKSPPESNPGPSRFLPEVHSRLDRIHEEAKAFYQDSALLWARDEAKPLYSALLQAENLLDSHGVAGNLTGLDLAGKEYLEALRSIVEAFGISRGTWRP